MDHSVMSSLIMDHNKRLQSIDEKVQKYIDIIFPLKDENNTISKRITVLEVEKEKTSDIIQQLKSADENKTQTITCLTDEVTSLLKRIQSLEDDKAKNSDIITSLTSADENKSQTITCLTDEVTDFSKRINSLENREKITADRMEKLQMENENFSKRLQFLERENVDLSKQMQSSKDAFSKQIRFLENEEVAISRTHQELKKKQNSNTDLMESLRLEIDMLKSATKKSISRVEKFEDGMQESETKLSDALEDVDRKTKSLIALQKQLGSLHVELQEKKEKMEATSSSQGNTHSRPVYARLVTTQTGQTDERTFLNQVHTSACHQLDGDFIQVDPSTGCVTVQEDGLYCFGLRGQQSREGEMRWCLALDGSRFGYGLGVTRSNVDVVSGMLLLPLKKGQKVSVFVWRKIGEARVCLCNVFAWCVSKAAFGDLESHRDGLHKYLYR